MAASSGTKLTPLRFVRSVLASFMAESGLEPRLFGQHLRIINAHMGIVDFELRITADHTNRLKILHGGTIASLVDLGGSLAVAAKGYYATGVSTDLNVTYLSSGGKEGDKLRGTAVCEKSKVAGSLSSAPVLELTLAISRQDARLHTGNLLGQGAESGCQGKPYQVCRSSRCRQRTIYYPGGSKDCTGQEAKSNSQQREVYRHPGSITEQKPGNSRVNGRLLSAPPGINQATTYEYLGLGPREHPPPFKLSLTCTPRDLPRPTFISLAHVHPITTFEGFVRPL